MQWTASGASVRCGAPRRRTRGPISRRTRGPSKILNACRGCGNHWRGGTAGHPPRGNTVLTRISTQDVRHNPHVPSSGIFGVLTWAASDGPGDRPQAARRGVRVPVSRLRMRVRHRRITAIGTNGETIGFPGGRLTCAILGEQPVTATSRRQERMAAPGSVAVVTVTPRLKPCAEPVAWKSALRTRCGITRWFLTDCHAGDLRGWPPPPRSTCRLMLDAY